MDNKTNCVQCGDSCEVPSDALDVALCNPCLDGLSDGNVAKSPKTLEIPKIMGCNTCGFWFDLEHFGNHFPCEESHDQDK